MTVETESSGIVASAFRPARWLRHRHLQTIYPSLPWAYPKKPALRREILDLPDGDSVAIDWVRNNASPATPLLLILHGLESSSESAYARMLMQAASDADWQCCVMHFRDCGDYRNRLPRRYHAGETNDLRFFLGQLEDDPRFSHIVAAGYSLGGNVLLKYLGEAGSETPLEAACAVCAPLDLHICAESLNSGFSMLYQKYLIKRMKSSLQRKFDPDTAAFDWHRAMRAETFAEFDDAVTAPLHGFRGMEDYYDRCSSNHFLIDIERPTLIVNALDDPFMSPDVIPDASRLSPAVTLEASEFGGHVGFIEGGTPLSPRFYLPKRIMGFLRPHVCGVDG